MAYADLPLRMDAGDPGDSLTIRAEWRRGAYAELDTGYGGAFEVLNLTGERRTPGVLGDALGEWLEGISRGDLVALLESAGDPTAERLRLYGQD